MSKGLSVLLVEDSERDAHLIAHELRSHGYALQLKRVQKEEPFLSALKEHPWDIIIADYSLPQFGAMSALNLLQKSGLDLPFIIVSGAIGEETAVAAMKAGAHDYIMKDKLARLVPALEREIRDAKVRLERRQAEAELINSRDQLRALAAKLQSVREEERKLITRDIHDELGQALTGFKMDLAWIRNRLQNADASTHPQVLQKIAEMGALVDATANTIRKLCTELRPGILDDLGLTAAIEWQAREFTKRTGIRCAVTAEAENLALDPNQTTAAFRIFQEILTNVARHAQASRVNVRLETTGKEVVLEASDNGRGIREAEIEGAKSLGLVGMRERALLLGGALELRGVPGKGTTVTVRLPQSAGAA
jgi:signal transduction histidine kinase